MTLDVARTKTNNKQVDCVVGPRSLRTSGHIVSAPPGESAESNSEYPYCVSLTPGESMTGAVESNSEYLYYVSAPHVRHSAHSAMPSCRTNKIDNFDEYSTYSDLILLSRSMICCWEAFVETPCPSRH